MVDAGMVGFILFVAFLAGVFFHYFRKSKTIEEKAYYPRLAFFIQLVSLTLLMFNGSTLISAVQIPCFMLAGYTFYTRRLAGKGPATDAAAEGCGVPADAVPAL
jgi:hypothetical protein